MAVLKEQLAAESAVCQKKTEIISDLQQIAQLDGDCKERLVLLLLHSLSACSHPEILAAKIWGARRERGGREGGRK